MYTTSIPIKQMRLFDVPVEKPEYLLIISPPSNVKKKINTIKKEFGIKFSSTNALHSVANITLTGFRANKKFEKNIIEKISKVCEFYSPVSLNLYNYNGFEPHTIYISVQKNYCLENLHYDLAENFNGNTGNFIPHLTIARQLTPLQYRCAFAEYSIKSFHETFVADRLLLLKKDDQFGPYKPFNEFILGKA